MNKRVRQYVGLISAVIAYYLIHEGTHSLYALSIGAFKQINLKGLGMQIDIYAEKMTQTQLGMFCLISCLNRFLKRTIKTYYQRQTAEFLTKKQYCVNAKQYCYFTNLYKRAIIYLVFIKGVAI